MIELDRKFVVPEHLFGIIGHPLGHSMSPLVHNRGFQTLGLPCIYLRWPLPAEKLPEFMAAARTLPISGVSVTIPHKRGVMPYLDGYTEDARGCGAVNTLYWVNDGLWGDNTDVLGFMTPLREQLPAIRNALILGNGGAARAALWGLKQSGVEQIAISGRNSEKSASLAQELGVDWVLWEQRVRWMGDLLVNATPLGMAGRLEGENPWPEHAEIKAKTVYDLVYNPQNTLFLRLGKAAGLQTISGLEMFLAQAAAQFRLWTGLELPLQAVRPLVVSVLQAR